MRRRWVWFEERQADGSTRWRQRQEPYPKCSCCGSDDREVDDGDKLCRGSDSCCAEIMKWALAVKIINESHIRGDYFAGAEWKGVVARWMKGVEWARLHGLVKTVDPSFWTSPAWMVAMDAAVHGVA